MSIRGGEIAVTRISASVEEKASPLSPVSLHSSCSMSLSYNSISHCLLLLLLLLLQGIGETFGRVTVEAMSFGLPVRILGG